MKTQVEEIVGRRIQALYLLEGDASPRQQLFLVFDDGTYYELYGDHIGTTSGVQWGDAGDVEQIAKDNKRKVRFKADKPVPGPDPARRGPSLLPRLTDVTVRVLRQGKEL